MPKFFSWFGNEIGCLLKDGSDAKDGLGKDSEGSDMNSNPSSPEKKSKLIKIL